MEDPLGQCKRLRKDDYSFYIQHMVFNSTSRFLVFYYDFDKLQSVASSSTWFSAAVLRVVDAEPNT